MKVLREKKVLGKDTHVARILGSVMPRAEAVGLEVAGHGVQVVAGSVFLLSELTSYIIVIF
jgi:hypothetical protein